jgi:predicted RNA-binding protein with PIN domain
VSTDRAVPALGDLPEEVRRRVHALVAEVLPDVAKLPAPLRKVAEFTPARRARLGAGPMTAALDSDEEFRDRVAVQVVDGLSEPVGQVMETAPGDSPVTTAAVAWLVRPDGWEDVLAAALAALAERPAAPDDVQVEHLRRQLAAAEQGARDVRSRHREEIAGLKEENAGLRRKLGETRAALREALTAADESGRAADQLRGQADTAAAAADSELRRLRARVARLEEDARADRRAGRTEREESTLRARLLLDAVIEAATGLRRELSLPHVSGSPGDRVEAALVSEGTRQPSSTGSLAPTSPSLLEQHLALPRTRLIVDGYNVSKSAWPSLPLEAQRTRLLSGLAPVVARTGAEATVVFDAAESAARPVVTTPRGVKAVFSPEGVIADRVIAELVAAEPEGRVVVVVSSDREVAQEASSAGARAVAAEALVGLLARTS